MNAGNTENTLSNLGLSLDRANAVLTTLAACYDSKSNKFVVTDEFVVQAIASIETFVGGAKKSLALLQNVSAPEVEVSIQKLIEPIQFPQEPTRFEIGFAEEPVPTPQEHATSYDALLRKITAAEVFAAEGQSNANAAVNSALVPLLKSLRQDLQNLRVA
jgi:hypothetical protein